VHFFSTDRGPGGTNEWRPMEDKERAFAEEAVAPPFSELISRWLEEGERLSEAMSTSRATAASLAETPVRQALARLRGGVERHRLAVLVCLGLLPVALFLATHHSTPHSAPVPIVAASASSLPPITKRPARSPPPTAVHELSIGAPETAPAARKAEVGAPKTAVAARKAVVTAPKVPRTVRRVAVGVPRAPMVARPVAGAVSQAPPAARQTAVVSPQAPLPARPVAVAAPRTAPVARLAALASPKAPRVVSRMAVAGPQAPTSPAPARRVTVASPKAPGRRQ
jgi:hypothetical protein